jgi:hypothetical protein
MLKPGNFRGLFRQESKKKRFAKNVFITVSEFSLDLIYYIPYLNLEKTLINVGFWSYSTPESRFVGTTRQKTAKRTVLQSLLRA